MKYLTSITWAGLNKNSRLFFLRLLISLLFSLKFFSLQFKLLFDKQINFLRLEYERKEQRLILGQSLPVPVRQLLGRRAFWYDAYVLADFLDFT